MSALKLVRETLLNLKSLPHDGRGGGISAKGVCTVFVILILMAMLWPVSAPADKQVAFTLKSLTAADIDHIRLVRRGTGPEIDAVLVYRLKESTGKEREVGSITVGLTPAEELQLRQFVVNVLIPRANRHPDLALEP